MWYVIQTVSGEEQDLKTLLESIGDPEVCRKCFIPVFEEVRRRADRYNIILRRLFPGYVFVDTDQPRAVFRTLRKIPDFTRLLGMEEEGGEKNFIPVEPEDEAFLNSLMEDGIMHVSYAHLSKSNRIDKVVGPLARYRNHITKLEFRRRTAIVEAEMFGKRRKIQFGLWTDGDPRLPWLERQMAQEQAAVLDTGVEMDIGIHPGDRFVDESGVYGDKVFVADRVDAVHRSVFTTFRMGDLKVRVELNADNVRKL